METIVTMVNTPQSISASELSQLAVLVQQHPTEIIEAWRTRVRESVSCPPDALWLNGEITSLLDRLPLIFADSAPTNRHLIRFERVFTRDDAATFSLGQILTEYRLLREILIEFFYQRAPLSYLANLLLNRFVDQSVASAIEEFSGLQEVSRGVQFRNERKARLVVKNQQRWLESILDRLPIALILLDPVTNKVTFSNKTAQAMLHIDLIGTVPSMRYGHAILAYDVSGRLLSPSEIPSARASSGEELRDAEVILQTPTGRYHVAASSERVPASFGHDNTVVLTLANISSIKATEEKLRNSRELLARVLKSSRVGFWDVDLATEHTVLSEQLAEDWGVDLATYTGTLKNIIERVHPEDRERVQSAIQAAIDENQPYLIEYRVVKPSGEIVYIEARGEILLDADNKPYHFTGTSLNITDRILARQKLEESEECFRRMADALPTIVWTADADGTVNYLNQRWYEYTGLNEAQSMGAGWAKSLHPEDQQLCLDTWLKCCTAGRLYEVHCRFKRHDGVYRWQLGRAVPIHDNAGRVIRWVGTDTDIDDQKKLAEELTSAKEAAEVANRTKSTFLANMSHEIRTPLGAIMGFIELMKTPGLTPAELNNYVAIVDRNSHQLLRIIDDILDLSKVEAGKMLIEHIDFSLTELLNDFSSLMNLRAQAKGITFDVHAQTPLPGMINTDPTRLRQILTNVVGNAIKFTEKGAVQLSLAYTPPVLTFTVSDTGPGITLEQAADLFQPFHQADPSTTRRFGGTGLGLVLTRRLSEALGGHFVLKHSTPGKGSVFVASIQAQIPANSKLIPSTDLKLVSPRSFPQTKDHQLDGMKILVVEDSPDNQVLLNLLLTKAGAAVELASDGHEGSTRALTKHYDVVLMDVQMPRMDGHEATKSLRLQSYGGPIIALTAHAMKEERTRCLQSGFNDFLSKPIQKKALMELLAQYRRRDVLDLGGCP